MNILLNLDIGAENLGWLKARYPGCSLQMEEEAPDALIAAADILMGWIDAKILAGARNLKWFHSASSGVDMFIDQVDSLRKELLVSNSAGVYGVPIAEHLLAMMLALAHRIDLSIRNMPGGVWGGLPPGRELSNSTVGIVGFGDIGQRLAGLLAPFGCDVLAFKRTPREKPPYVSQMLYGEEGLDELMARADHVCLCLPGTPQTKGVIDGRRIGLMKPTACLYNIGRGTTVDTDALAEALYSGRIAGAGLDVTDPEPLPPDHPLWRAPNAIITPHISGLTLPNREKRLAETFARNLDAYLAGLPLPGAIDRMNRY